MDGLKQRIIGALVLISLAVIFVPMIFDEPHSGRTSTSIRIPEEPPFPEVITQSPPPVLMSEDQRAPAIPASGRVDNADNSAKFQLIEGVSPQKSESVAVTPEPAVVAETSPAPTRSDPEPEPESQINQQPDVSLKGAWVVQLGSFGSADNARRLRDNARDKGYSSHLQEFISGDTPMTRVFSGPFASKSEALAAKAALDKAFSLNSLVTSGNR